MPLKLSARDRDLLELICSGVRGFWFRPMDLGGWDGSYHSATLAKFVRYAWVERRLRGGHTRTAYAYRAKPAGRAALAKANRP